VQDIGQTFVSLDIVQKIDNQNFAAVSLTEGQRAKIGTRGGNRGSLCWA
jgi:hypothetical protein